MDVTQVKCDNEFECVEDLIRPANLFLVGANEHVGDVERSVRTVKDCTRYHVHRLPYIYYPKIMVAGMVTHVIKSLNQLPTESGIDTHLSPASLITGSPVPDFNNIMLNYGDYVQPYEPNTSGNDQSPRSIGAIDLYPRNGKTWYFISLQTGKRVHRHGWTVLPATKEVVNRVNYLCRKQNQPKVHGNFKYKWVPEGDDSSNDWEVEEESITSENQEGTNEVDVIDTEVNTGRLVRDLQENGSPRT